MGRARGTVTGPAARDFVAIARRYAQQVVDGKIVAGKWVHRACERHLRDLAANKSARSTYAFVRERAERVCKFVELCPHIKGPLAGTLIVLEPWQIFILCCVFGWTVRATGHRRFHRVYIEVPRGNGKSALSSAIALYMLCADGEEGAEVYCFATTRDQARLVFDPAKVMAQRSPGMRKHFGVEVNAHNINQFRTASKLEPAAAEGSTLDGLNTHFGCIDELHAHKTRAVYDVVETSIGKRAQPLLWVITTAGSNRAGICYEVRGFALKVLEGKAEDESQFAIVYGLDDGDDWTTEEALRKANPNWGVSVMPDKIRALQSKAMSMASAANNFRTKHCNEWMNADVAWMDMRAWDRCADPSLSREQFAGARAILSLDLASKVDVASKIELFPLGNDEYAVFARHYLPTEAVEKGENSQYSGWQDEGWLTVTEGAVTDYGVIEQDVLADCSVYDVLEVPYDPFQATQLSSRLMKEGVPMVEMRPTVLNFSEPMKKVEALVLSGKLRHNGDPVLTWMVSNVVCHRDAKDNVYPRKERQENKIDGAVALIMAVGRAVARETEEAASMMFGD